MIWSGKEGGAGGRLVAVAATVLAMGAGTVPVQARDTASTRAPAAASQPDYQSGYKSAFLRGSSEGQKDARLICRAVSRHHHEPGESQSDRGWIDGYNGGYQAGFHSGLERYCRGRSQST